MLFIAIKNLFQEKTKLAISVGGVSFAVLLIIIINALYQGFNTQMGAYPKSIPADLWVEQAGVGDMYHTLSFLPNNLSGRLENIQGVNKATPYLGRQVMLTLDGKEQSFFLVGIDPRVGTTKPYKMKSGNWQDLKDGEIIIDEIFANEKKLKVGDNLDLGGEILKIAGISSGGNIISFQYSFITMRQAKKMFNLGEKVNFYIITLDSNADPTQVKKEIKNTIDGVDVLTKKEFIDASRKVLTDTFLPIIYVLVIIGLIIGVAVIGLTTYSATIEKVREYGVMKAIGISNFQLFKMVLFQSLISGFFGFVIGAGLAYFVSYIATNIVSAFVTEIRLIDLIWVLGATIFMSLAASYIPTRRIAKIDPAEVFKS